MCEVLKLLGIPAPVAASAGLHRVGWWWGVCCFRISMESQLSLPCETCPHCCGREEADPHLPSSDTLALFGAGFYEVSGLGKGHEPGREC